MAGNSGHQRTGKLSLSPQNHTRYRKFLQRKITCFFSFMSSKCIFYLPQNPFCQRDGRTASGNNRSLKKCHCTAEILSGKMKFLMSARRKDSKFCRSGCSVSSGAHTASPRPIPSIRCWELAGHAHKHIIGLTHYLL